MDLIQIKTGDSFSWLLTDTAGDLTGITITAAVRTTGKVTRPLTVTEVDLSAGQYQISATGEETAQWPVGFLPCDLKYSATGVSSHTETFKIYVSEGITP